MATDLYCSNCNREFEEFEDVTVIHGGIVEPFLDLHHYVASDDGPNYQTLCKRCGSQLVLTPRADAPQEESDLQLAKDRSTALHVAAILAIADIDTGFPAQAKHRLQNLLSSTKMVIQPNRVVVEVAGQQVLFISAERPKELVVIIHDEEKGHSWDRTHTVRKLMIAECEEEARPLQHPKLRA